jgi:hypothetical protein
MFWFRSGGGVAALHQISIFMPEGAGMPYI